jgi:MFS transporter, DHA2 family, multidrug resistance protein
MSSPDPPTRARARAPARTWVGLCVLLLPALLTGMDASVLFVAAAPIGEALQPSTTQWLWAMDVYSFVMAGLLITMGSLGDRIGRRRLLLIGAAVFGMSSVLLAYASNPSLLILARAVLAVGGATLAPSTLSLVRAMFDDEQQRRAAVGAWTVAFAGGAVAGPIIAGVLLEHFWWGAVFLINLPIMALLLVAARFVVAESKNPRPARFDLLGAAISLAATLSLVFAMKQAATTGLGWIVGGSVLVGLAAGTGFLARQRRSSHPLVDLVLFRSRAFATAIVINTIGAGVISGLGVLVFPFLQVVHGLTPLQSALWAIPTFVGILLGSTAAAALAARFSAASLVTSGLLTAAAGLVIIATTLEPRSSLSLFLGAYTTLTFGAGLTTTMATSLVLTNAPARQAGTVAGISETSAALGSALGIATLGTMAAVTYRSTMNSSAPYGTDPAALETIIGAATAADSSPHAIGESLLTVAYAAYTHGLTTAASAGAALITVLAAIAAIVLRSRHHPSTP